MPDCEFGPPFDGLYEKDNALELPDTMPHPMRCRYKLLLEKARPEDRMEGTPAHLSWLETKYGHLVEKPFWYHRVVKLANAYRDNKGGEVSHLSHSALEAAVGHLVPLTPQEQERLHAESTVQKPDCEFGPPLDGLYDQELPVTEVLEEGEIPSAADMVKNLLADQKVLEFPHQLPHLMGFRYKLLLEKCRPQELIEPPSSPGWKSDMGTWWRKSFGTTARCSWPGRIRRPVKAMCLTWPSVTWNKL